MLKSAIETVQNRVFQGPLTDPDVVLYCTRVSVWGRWFIWLVSVFLFAYRPGFWYSEYVEFLVLPVLVFTSNSLVHYRLLTRRPVTTGWLMFLSAMDVILITGGVAMQGGYHSFIFLAYYPALAVVAVVFLSFWFTVAWTTTAVVAYAVVCVLAGPGLDLDAGDEKVLLSRLAVIYTMVVGLSLITRFERARWQTAVSRERRLRRERIQLSQTFHDTIAQTVYMIGLGIHRARQLAGKSNEDLTAALDAASTLSRSAMWEVRGPIDAGHIVEGRELGRVLWSHCATFERITAVPAELSLTGTEPLLDAETRTGLFSIAHNALTNAFLHAQPSRVDVRLNFEGDRIRLSVSDDGIGLPAGYAEKGRGFHGMSADAERMGGTLIVESAKGAGGTTITCVVPRQEDEGGD